MVLNMKVSVVMPAYNEELGVGKTVSKFMAIPEVDEVVVVNNNSTDNTEKYAINAGARVVVETKQGYGHAVQRALKEAKNDIIVLVESDDTYYAEDIYKLLAYKDHFDIVKSSRYKPMCTDGAAWSWPSELGNVIVAKYLQILYNGPPMVEAGGTMRLIHKPALHKIQKYFTQGDGAFLPDMVTIALRKKLKILEIPLRYKDRAGTSKENPTYLHSAILALKMIFLITKNRFKRLK